MELGIEHGTSRVYCFISETQPPPTLTPTLPHLAVLCRQGPFTMGGALRTAEDPGDGTWVGLTQGRHLPAELSWAQYL